MEVIDYLKRLGDATSQLLNVAIFMGKNPNESLSGRAYRERKASERYHGFWWYMHLLINCLFFWQGNHCKAAYTADLARARELSRAQVNQK